MDVQNMPMHVVIMAGGRGTRIAEVRSDVPKPMIDVCGKPVLQRTLEMLHRQNYNDVTLVIGYLGHIIRDYFGDGSSFGMHIDYYEEKTPLGTAGALVAMREKLTEDFLLLNGDIIIDMDIARMERFHREHKALATIAVHPNSHPYDSAIVVADSEGKVTHWYAKDELRPPCRNMVNAGVHILSKMILSRYKSIKYMNLDNDMLRSLIDSKQLYAYRTTEYIKDMGTPQRYKQVCKEVESGIPERKNLRNKQSAIFFDRDGTLSEDVGYVIRPENVVLAKDAAKVVRTINESGYLAILVTNQPVIARGDCTWQELESIQARFEELLGLERAYLDDTYICPHHPDSGFIGEIIEYKVKCTCRKPEPGMLLSAAKEYNIDLHQSWMVGDSWRDMEAGKRAGCSTYLVGKDNPLYKVCELCLK